MSFCDEHGTADYCGECVYGPEIERLTAERDAAQAEARELRERFANLQRSYESTYQAYAALRGEVHNLQTRLKYAERARGIKDEIESALRAELARVRGLLNSARCPNCDGSGSIAHGPTASGDWEQEQCQWCDERSALSQPAEQQPADHCEGLLTMADLPLMARRIKTPKWAVGACIDRWGSVIYVGSLEGARYRIADTDEHGLPVIPRTADMPEGATHKITWLDDGKVDFTDCAPMALEANRSGGMSERIEDYNEHGQEGRE